jgi:uncharacterized protein DUF5677
VIDGDEYVLSSAYEALSTGLGEKRPPLELAVDLANAAGRLTKDRRRLHERIEQKLEVPWGGPFAQLEMLITLTVDFAVAWGRRGEEQLLESGDARVEAVTALHARGASAASEVLRMLRAGLPGAALARWRTLYEQATTAIYLATEDQRFARRYLRVQWIEYANYLRKRCELFGDETSAEDRSALEGAEQMRQQAQEEFPDLTSARAWQRDVENGIRNMTFADLQRRVGLSDSAEVPYQLANLQIHASHLGFTMGMGAIHGVAGHMVMPVFLDLEKAGMVTAPALNMLTDALMALWSDPQAVAEAEVLNSLADATVALFDLTGTELLRRDQLVARAAQGESVELPWLDQKTAQRAHPTRQKKPRKQTEKKRRRS